jgi:flavin-dependent dehydrogenase
MKLNTADVIVVGGGPIGAYAAWQFAAKGLEVVCLEQRKANQAASDIGAFHFEDIAFERTGVPRPKPSQVICDYPDVVVHPPQHDKFVRVSGIHTWALDLTAFIRDLRKSARDAGAVFRYGRQARELLREGNRITGVVAAFGEKEETYRAPVTVDATGLVRSLRRQVPGLDFPGAHRQFNVYMEYWSDADTPPPDGIHSYLGPNTWTARYPGYWIAGMGRELPLDRLKAEHALWFGDLYPGKKKLQRAVTGAIPYAFAPPTLVTDGLLVLGDAAATNKPFNGEGIASGMIPARLAADVLPSAVKAGGSRVALWEINRRYYTDQGAKFAFLLAMGHGLLSLTEDEVMAAFDAGLISAEDLRQTFYNYTVQRPILEWAMPLARLSRRVGVVRKYGAALLRAVQIARHVEKYPTARDFPVWATKYRKLVGHFG